VDAGSNRVWVHLVYPTLGAEIVEIVLEEQSGWILASIPDAGWLPRLSEEQQHRFRLALAGWYRKAGVDLLREEVAARLGSSCPPYDITDLGLLVWPGHDYHTEVVYDLEDEPRLSPQVMHGSPSNQMPELDANQLLLSRRDMAWSDWVAAWEADAAASNQLKQWLGVDQWK
jgi:hypothetical protein